MNIFFVLSMAGGFIIGYTIHPWYVGIVVSTLWGAAMGIASLSGRK